MPPTPSPRSRKPSTYPPIVINVIEEGISNEILIPFENEDKLAAFRRLFAAVRRSYRDWQHEKWEEVNSLRAIDVRTVDIKRERPAYDVDEIRFPWTTIISPAIGFLPNFSEAISLRNPVDPLPAPPINREIMALEDELTSIMREEASGNDANEIAEFFKSRRKNDV